MTEIYDFNARTIDGKDISLSKFKGKTLLIVNTASKCGFTKQYNGLETMYQNHKNNGLVVLGFPCNQFGSQEPGDEEEIKNFCSTSFDVTFPMFSKIDVNGPDTHPLYAYLKDEKPGLAGTKKIKWNFTKFLVDPDGNVKKRYAPTDTPEKIEKAISGNL